MQKDVLHGPVTSAVPELRIIDPGGGAEEERIPEVVQKFALPQHLIASIESNATAASEPASTDARESEAPEIPGSSATAPITDDEHIRKLAVLKPMDYDRIRKEAAKTLGIQAKTLDDLIKAARTEDSGRSRLPFQEVEPHDDPIDPASLLDEIAATIRRYVVLGKEQADAVAVWIAMTWLIDDVLIAAILIITAPEKACGKSQLLELVGRMVARPLSAASSTASFLFRAIEAWKPTLLIDEADTFIRENEELKGLVNAGHTRANAYVGRTVSVGDGHEPKLFNVWGAKAFAGIALERHLPDATMSRGIEIVMGRKMQHEVVERLRHAPPDLFSSITSKLARFAEDYAEQVRSARPLMPDELSDRAQDNWYPLVAIAQCAGPVWVERVTTAALKLSGSGSSAPSTGNELLTDIRDVFAAKGARKISTVDLIAELVAADERPWATYNRGKALSPRQLAKQLAGYGIQPKTIRQQFGTPKGYDAGQFEDAFARYLAAPAEIPPQRNDPSESFTDLDCGVVDGSRPGHRTYPDSAF